MQDSIARARDRLRRVQGLRLLLAACLAIALAACQAGSAPADADVGVDTGPTTPAVTVASAPSPATAPVAGPGDAFAPTNGTATAPTSPPADSAPVDEKARAAETGGTDPVAAVPATPGRADALLDRCSSDADCEVKDVGSCCGYRPRCLHRDSPTFADEVKARCKAEGRVGHCGIADVAGCACQAGRCVDIKSPDAMLVQ
jgi:hypothetical protein